MQAFKSLTTTAYITGVKEYGWPPFPGRLWQRNYHEHVIRNEQDLHDIREYMLNNAIKHGIRRGAIDGARDGIRYTGGGRA